MSSRTILTAVLVNEDATLSFMEVCERYAIEENVLIEFIEHGLLAMQSLPVTRSTVFNERMLDRIRAAQRLQQDLHINTPGVVLALELLDELEALRQQLRLRGDGCPI